VGIRLFILSGEVFNSGKNLFTSGPNWSGAGAFEVYLWAERTLPVEFKLSGGEEGLVWGSEPALEVDEDDHWECGSARAGMNLGVGVEWESRERGGDNDGI